MYAPYRGRSHTKKQNTQKPKLSFYEKDQRKAVKNVIALYYLMRQRQKQIQKNKREKERI